MRMLLSTLALAAVATGGVAQAQSTTDEFEHDGTVYRYTETVDGDRTILRGRAYPGGPFRLVVENGEVRGRAGLLRVRFSVEEAFERAGLDYPVVASAED